MGERQFDFFCLFSQEHQCLLQAHRFHTGFKREMCCATQVWVQIFLHTWDSDPEYCIAFDLNGVNLASNVLPFHTQQEQ